MAPNLANLQGLVTCMVPNLTNLQGLVTCMAPNPANLHGSVTLLPGRESGWLQPEGEGREEGGREGGRKGAPTWSERAAWREGGVSLSTRLLVRSAWQCRELDLVSVYLVGHTARPLSVRALH